MAAPQYAILRFAKYKGPEISGIEAHNERTKEKYASKIPTLTRPVHTSISTLSSPKENIVQNARSRSQKPDAAHARTAFVWWKL